MCRFLGRLQVGTGMSSLVPASTVALTVEDLCKSYGKAFTVGPLSFSLATGSTTGLLGAIKVPVPISRELSSNKLILLRSDGQIIAQQPNFCKIPCYFPC